MPTLLLMLPTKPFLTISTVPRKPGPKPKSLSTSRPGGSMNPSNRCGSASNT